MQRASHPTVERMPGEEGWRMPAEWEMHSATWLTWPHDEAHWPGYFHSIPPIWARTVKELETGEDVHIVIHDDATERSAMEAMQEAGVMGSRVHLHRAANNWSWARDHGPIFVKNPKGELRITDWIFNGWGGQWDCDLDDALPKQVSSITGIPLIEIPMVLEGGSIDVNGLGTLLTTESCLLSPNRNPGFTKEQIEQHLRNYFDVTNILWLGEGIQGDDTSGHIDDLTRFVGPHTIVTIVGEDPHDPDYAPLQENLERLRTMTDQDGQPLEIITLPQPKPVLIYDKPAPGSAHVGKSFRIPASYANFYIANSVILLPVWNDPNDAKAIDILQQCFPDRRIAPMDSRELTWGLGSFHCITQQQPR